MAERKVLVKYYPPDFDADLLYKNKRSRDKQDNVRMMLPMSLQCITCGVYLYIGSKFNMRKENVLDEDYLGLQLFRFYLKCYACYSEITFKTDPKNHDYIVEGGGRRNYEPWRDTLAAQEKLSQLKELEEEGNAMKFLENKTFDSKREMDILDALDEIRTANKKKADITVDDVFMAFYQNQNRKEKDLDNEQLYDLVAKKVFDKRVRLEEEEEQQMVQFNIENNQLQQQFNKQSKQQNDDVGQKNGKQKEDEGSHDGQQKRVMVFNNNRITFKIKKLNGNDNEIKTKEEEDKKEEVQQEKCKKVQLDYSSDEN